MTDKTYQEWLKLREQHPVINHTPWVHFSNFLNDLGPCPSDYRFKFSPIKNGPQHPCKTTVQWVPDPKPPVVNYRVHWNGHLLPNRSTVVDAPGNRSATLETWAKILGMRNRDLFAIVRNKQPWPAP